MYKFIIDDTTSMKRIGLLISNFFCLLILTLGFFWRPIFINRHLLTYISYETILYFILAALFFYVFMYLIFKVKSPSAILSTVIFVFGGVLLRFSFTDVGLVKGIIWLPLVLTFFLKSIETQNYKYVILCGLSINISMVASRSFLAVELIFLVLILYILFNFFEMKKIKKSFISSFLLLLVTTFFVTFFVKLTGFKFSYQSIDQTKELPFLLNKGWFLGIYIGILPLLLLRLFFISKIKRRIARFYCFLFLFSLLSLLGINLIKQLKILTNFSLAIFVGLGMEIFLSPFSRVNKKHFQGYVRKMNSLAFFISIVILPILFALLFKFYGSGLENTSIAVIGNICLMHIFFCISVLIFNIRLMKKGSLLAGFMILLVVLNIFSYWSMFRGKNLKNRERLNTQPNPSTSVGGGGWGRRPHP